MQTITAACNFYNETNALSGWLESASAFFDEILLINAGPGGKKSNDGSIEIAEKWGVRILYDAIDGGFGKIRTRLIRESRTDYVAILDADERFHRYAPILECTGQPTPDDVVNAVLQEYDNRDDKRPSNWENLKLLGLDLRAKQTGHYDQGQFLRDILEHKRPDVVCAIRRHWHDFTWKRPTQDWGKMPDLQWRIIRCDDKIGFDLGKRMHESLDGFDPAKVVRPHNGMGPFYDHFHLAIKRMEVEQRREDIRIYDAINRGEAP